MDESVPTVEGLQRQLLELRISIVEKEQLEQKREIEKHDARLRPVEDTVVCFNFLLYLTMGGGLVGIFNLFVTIVTLVLKLQ